MIWIHVEIFFILLVFIMKECKATGTKYVSDKACTHESTNDVVLTMETSSLVQCSIHCHAHKCDRFEYFESGKLRLCSSLVGSVTAS